VRAGRNVNGGERNQGFAQRLGQVSSWQGRPGRRYRGGTTMQFLQRRSCDLCLYSPGPVKFSRVRTSSLFVFSSSSGVSSACMVWYMPWSVSSLSSIWR
jgi:hypothetical protein